MVMLEKARECLNRGLEMGPRRARDAIHYLAHRAWVLEIALFSVSAGFFTLLWWHSGIAKTPVSQYIQTTWAILPVLAVTNALPMLGVDAFLGRYSLADKPSETLAALSALVNGDYGRINGHPRENPFQRRSVFYSALRRAKTNTFSFTEGKETLYTPRPYWDGVWFHGSSSYRETKEVDWRILYPTHELIFCATMMLRVVAAFRESGSFSIDVREISSGTQGSKWFLEEFTKHQHLLLRPLAWISQT
jgi:hypothetical protein